MPSPAQPRASALLPLLLFLLIFLGSGIYYSLTGTDFAFYQIKAPVAILPAIILGLLLAKPCYRDNLQTFIDGIGDRNIITMALVFLLAGAFSSVTKAIGGVDATVNMGLSILPPSLILPGLFVIAVFISTSMGTSMGTIGALVPIALGFSEVTGLSLPLARMRSSMSCSRLSVTCSTLALRDLPSRSRTTTCWLGFRVPREMRPTPITPT